MYKHYLLEKKVNNHISLNLAKKHNERIDDASKEEIGNNLSSTDFIGDRPIIIEGCNEVEKENIMPNQDIKQASDITQPSARQRPDTLSKNTHFQSTSKNSMAKRQLIQKFITSLESSGFSKSDISFHDSSHSRSLITESDDAKSSVHSKDVSTVSTEDEKKLLEAVAKFIASPESKTVVSSPFPLHPVCRKLNFEENNDSNDNDITDISYEEIYDTKITLDCAGFKSYHLHIYLVLMIFALVSVPLSLFCYHIQSSIPPTVDSIMKRYIDSASASKSLRDSLVSCGVLKDSLCETIIKYVDVEVSAKYFDNLKNSYNIWNNVALEIRSIHLELPKLSNVLDYASNDFITSNIFNILQNVPNAFEYAKPLLHDVTLRGQEIYGYVHRCLSTINLDLLLFNVDQYLFHDDHEVIEDKSIIAFGESNNDNYLLTLQNFEIDQNLSLIGLKQSFQDTQERVGPLVTMYNPHAALPNDYSHFQFSKNKDSPWFTNINCKMPDSFVAKSSINVTKEKTTIDVKNTDTELDSNYEFSDQILAIHKEDFEQNTYSKAIEPQDELFLTSMYSVFKTDDLFEDIYLLSVDLLENAGDERFHAPVETEDNLGTANNHIVNRIFIIEDNQNYYNSNSAQESIGSADLNTLFMKSLHFVSNSDGNNSIESDISNAIECSRERNFVSNDSNGYENTPKQGMRMTDDDFRNDTAHDLRENEEYMLLLDSESLHKLKEYQQTSASALVVNQENQLSNHWPVPTFVSILTKNVSDNNKLESPYILSSYVKRLINIAVTQISWNQNTPNLKVNGQLMSHYLTNEIIRFLYPTFIALSIFGIFLILYSLSDKDIRVELVARNTPTSYGDQLLVAAENIDVMEFVDGDNQIPQSVSRRRTRASVNIQTTPLRRSKRIRRQTILSS